MNWMASELDLAFHSRLERRSTDGAGIGLRRREDLSGATPDLACYLLFRLFQCREVPLHFLERLLQVGLELRLLYSRQQLTLDLPDVVLMKLDLMLNEGTI